MWTSKQIADAKSRLYKRDRRGRFATSNSLSSKADQLLAVKYREVPSGPSKKVPPTWDKIKGTNAKRDGLALYKRKKAGEFKDDHEIWLAAGKLGVAYKKAHPQDKNAASTNQIVNAYKRHEFDDTGKVHLLGETIGKPDLPEPFDKTSGGMCLVSKDVKPQKARSGNEIRNEMRSLLPSIEVDPRAWQVNTTAEDKKKLEAWKAAVRKYADLEEELQSAPVKRDRKLSEATDYIELRDIMEDRHPRLHVSNLEILDGLLDKAIEGHKDILRENKVNSKGQALFHDELLAEAFADTQINGDKASVISKRLLKMMEDNLAKAKTHAK